MDLMENKSFAEVRQIAKDLGVDQYWRKKRVDLIKSINEIKGSVEGEIEVSDSARTYRIYKLAEIIAKYHKVELVCSDKNVISFRGEKSKIEAAKDDFDFYFAEISRIRVRLWRRAKRNNMDTTGLEKSFDLGYLQGLINNMKLTEKVQINPEQYLQKIKLLKDYFDIGIKTFE